MQDVTWLREAIREKRLLFGHFPKKRGRGVQLESKSFKVFPLTDLQNGGGGARPLLDNVQKKDAFFSDGFSKKSQSVKKSARIWTLSKLL